MSEILTKAGQEVTHIDDARAYNFDAGNRSGIVKGAFNEGRFFAVSNVIAFDSCELRIAGHRIVNENATSFTLTNKPTTNVRYSLVAELIVDDSSVPRVTFMTQNSSTPLRKDNLYKTAKGSGTYQLEIGRFTLTPAGTIIDVVRTVDVITGGGNGSLTDIEFNATAYDLESDKQPEVSVDFNEETGKYDMNIGIPRGQNGLDGSGSNPNLLINGDFRVNQRGQGSYTLASGFCVDTWYYANSQITKLEKGVNVHIINAWGNFAQVIENAQSFAGKTITASAKISNFQQFGNAGNIKLFIVVNKSLQIQGSALITKDGTYAITSTIPDITITELKVMIANYSSGVIDTSFDVEWIKLEIGLIATAFSPRPYAEEFNNCQRYLQVKSSAFTFETKGIDRSPAMREDGTISTITIENVSYNMADAEIKPV